LEIKPISLHENDARSPLELVRVRRITARPNENKYASLKRIRERRI
jgi:hypothetical protein